MKKAAAGGPVKNTLLVLVSTFAFAACATNDSKTPPAPSSDGNEGVTMKVATPERLTGTYVDATGLSLEFDTARAGDDFYLHLATSWGHELIHAETTAPSYVFRYLDRRLTLEVDKAWVAQVQAEGDDGPAMKDERAMHWTGDMTVLDEMIAMPEIRALPWMSRALGSLGYTGSQYPASLAMHKMARQSAEA